MSFDFLQFLITIFINTVSGLIANIFYILLFIWAVKLVGKEIKILAKNIPQYIEQYFKLQQQNLRIAYAKESMRKL